MTLVVPQNGEGDALTALVNKGALSDLILHLFQNNVTPGATDTTATYTEANFTGYANVTLTGANWTVTEATPSYATFANQTFTSTAGSQNQSVYGYYLTRSLGGRIAWAERFSDGPYVIVNNGDSITVAPRVTAS